MFELTSGLIVGMFKKFLLRFKNGGEALDPLSRTLLRIPPHYLLWLQRIKLDGWMMAKENLNILIFKKSESR